jgi:hypothetical protein
MVAVEAVLPACLRADLRIWAKCMRFAKAKMTAIIVSDC